MLARFFHAWERRLAAATTDRVVRPFEWGLEWLPENDGPSTDAAETVIQRWVAQAVLASDRFFAVTPAADYALQDGVLTFPSAYTTPHAENNMVYARYFPAEKRTPSRSRKAVVVLPQWNADAESHVALCRWLTRAGMSALRLSLPYHDRRMPPELHRADYIVSSNIVRTVQVCRQAVLDARRAVGWLALQGYHRIGILGTSLGSCLAMLTTAHEPLVGAAALNHISPYFADVVWEGLSTTHVRAGLEGSLDLDRLRELWLPISPRPFVERVKDRKILLVYARYDLSFPVGLSRSLVDDFARAGVTHDVIVLPCGHYSTGIAPFSWMDGYAMVRFLQRHL
jgi:dienelactone hydrolase